MSSPRFILEPGPALHLEVRAKFVANGTSLDAWCKANGVNRSNADYALTRPARLSAKARELREKICRAAGLLDHKPRSAS